MSQRENNGKDFCAQNEAEAHAGFVGSRPPRFSALQVAAICSELDAERERGEKQILELKCRLIESQRVIDGLQIALRPARER